MFGRFLNELGFLYLVLGLAIIIPVLVIAFGKIYSFEAGAYILLFLNFSLLFSIHGERKDKKFLNLISEKAASKVLIAEYLLLSLPFILMIVFTKHWFLAPVCIATSFFVPIVNYSYKKKNIRIANVKFIPATAFEWKSGLRKTFVIFVLIWLAGAATSFWVSGTVAAIILLNFIVVSFYMEGEPKLLLEVFEKPPTTLIKFKIKQALSLFWLMVSPLVLLFFIFHFQYWYVMLYLFVAASMMLIFSITQKYAFYEENADMSRRNGIFCALAAFAFYNPMLVFLLPVMFFLCYRFYNKSVKNLMPYLYAYYS